VRRKSSKPSSVEREHEYYNGTQKGQMSRGTISTFQVFELFPDQHAARKYLEHRLWPSGATCPGCGKGERITGRNGDFYRCNACKLDFTVRTGTIFERSHVPLHKWLYAMYLLVHGAQGNLFNSVGERDRYHSEIGMVRPSPAPRSLWRSQIWGGQGRAD